MTANKWHKLWVWWRLHQKRIVLNCSV